MIIESHELVPMGVHVLWRRGKVVWWGKLGMPIEDVEFDKIQVNPADFERIKAEMPTANKRTLDR